MQPVFPSGGPDQCPELVLASIVSRGGREGFAFLLRPLPDQDH